LSPGQVSPGAIRRFLRHIREDMGKSDLTTASHTSHSLIADLEFEKTLRYVDIPIVVERRTSYKALGHDEDLPDYAPIIFKWLRQKGASHICEVRIVDSYDNPHSEEHIIDALEGLDVQVLDWRRTDLSVDVIQKAAPHVKDLCLYSSGNWCALSHWLGPDGVVKLKCVRL